MSYDDGSNEPEPAASSSSDDGSGEPEPASSSSDAANNGGGNPTTGITIAIVPAVVAAAGVIISKKRK